MVLDVWGDMQSFLLPSCQWSQISYDLGTIHKYDANEILLRVGNCVIHPHGTVHMFLGTLCHLLSDNGTVCLFFA